MKLNKQDRITYNLYDIITEIALPKNQNDEYAILKRKHCKEARRELFKIFSSKNICWNGDNSIEIGKQIKIIVGASK